MTPLHVAASLGHLACLQLLVQSGGDILFTDNRNRTPLDCATSNGQELCLGYLQDQIGMGGGRGEGGGGGGKGEGGGRERGDERGD